jgi:methylated-DNA-[protein]-cysteine S-methyltransferase
MNHLLLQSSIGTLVITWNSKGLLSSIDLKPLNAEYPPCSGPVPSAIIELIGRFHGYFERGEPVRDIPWHLIDQEEWSPFQLRVYRAIADIPHGETRTYAWVAARVGNVFASRAVGQALRKNPLPVLIPCHRVVSGTSLGGFMGESDPNQPELQLKKTLIGLEESYLNPMFSFLGGPALAPAWGVA